MTWLGIPHDPVGEPGDSQEVPHGVQTLGKRDHGSPRSAGGFTDTWAPTAQWLTRREEKSAGRNVQMGGCQ